MRRLLCGLLTDHAIRHTAAAMVGAGTCGCGAMRVRWGRSSEQALRASLAYPNWPTL